MTTTFRRGRTLSRPPATVAFSPTDLSGLKVWYSAAAETGYTNDQAMTQWTDRSGNNNHATAVGTNKPAWQSSTGPSGGAAVHFTGVGIGGGGEVTGHFTLPTSLMGSATAGEIFYQVKVDTTKPSNGAGQLHTFGLTDYCYYGYTDASVYDGFGGDFGQRKTVGSVGGTGVIGAWHKLNISAATNDYALRINGASTYSSSSYAVGWTTLPAIGAGSTGGGAVPSSGSAVQPFKGWVSTVLLFNRKLTTGERGDVLTWMAANPSG